MIRLVPWIVGAMGGLAVLAQTEGTIPVPYAEYTAQACLIFLVGWLITRTLPTREHEHREEREREQAGFRAERERAQDHFEKSLKSICEHHHESVKELSTAIKSATSVCAAAQQIIDSNKKDS